MMNDLTQEELAKFREELEPWGIASPYTLILFEQAERLLDMAERTLAAEAKVARLREALQALYDEQNGPPLIRDEMAWNEAMHKAEKALEETR